jgi:hypothetical protein
VPLRKGSRDFPATSRPLDIVKTIPANIPLISKVAKIGKGGITDRDEKCGINRNASNGCQRK